ncbi:hypothetical protein D3C77_190970 [compost metagenome]
MSKNAESTKSLLEDLGARKLHLINLIKIIKGNYKILTPVEACSINVINLEIQRIEDHLRRR